MKRTEYDRALIGPDSYEYFNNLSKTCQNRYLRIVGSQLIILLVISLLAAVPATTQCFDKGKHILELSLIISVLVLMIIQFRSNYMDGWQKSRFLAESILSQTWLLLFKINKYDTELNQALTLLQENIGEMKKEVVADAYYKLATQKSSDNDRPKWVLDNFDNSENDKIEFYIRERLNDQEGYYFKKTKSNSKKSGLYFWIGLGAMTVGAILTILTIADVIPDYSYLGLFTTLSAALFSWKQTKRFEELSSTYSVAIEELKDFKKKLLSAPNFSEAKNIVYDCEKSISREHKLWVSKVS
jgi:Ca2+/Na+ antiporter